MIGQRKCDAELGRSGNPKGERTQSFHETHGRSRPTGEFHNSQSCTTHAEDHACRAVGNGTDCRDGEGVNGNMRTDGSTSLLHAGTVILKFKANR